MSFTSRRWVAAAVFAACQACAGLALAHSKGQPQGGCEGCHAGDDNDVAVATSPASFSPGDPVTVTVTITSPVGSVAGMFVDADAGALSAISGQGLGEVGMGLTHTNPKALSGGSVSFAFAWAAPASPGAVRFDVWTVVANGNGSSSGDHADKGAFDFVYGCDPFTYFRDADGDGHGQDDQTMIHCVGTTPAGYSKVGGDCNDNSETIYPGALEVCNEVDDDCNDVVDDDAVPLDLYLDADGDGYYGAAEYAMGVQGVGCVPAKDLAGYPGDCAPDDPAVHPGAEDVCNLVDDNCDYHVDEHVRPRCGEGWCVREAPTCDPGTCVPGEPTPEVCNLLDDDCDGDVDEDAPCDPGLVCSAGACIDAGLPAGAGSGAEDGGGDGCTVAGRPASPFALVAWGLASAWAVLRRPLSRRWRGPRPVRPTPPGRRPPPGTPAT